MVLSPDLASHAKHSTMQHTPSTTTTPKFAYTMLIAGISSDIGAYRGYLYNALLLPPKKLNPTASYDFVLLLMFDSGASASLPSEEEALLEKYGIKKRVVEPFFGAPSFYTAIMTKMAMFFL